MVRIIVLVVVVSFVMASGAFAVDRGPAITKGIITDKEYIVGCGPTTLFGRIEFTATVDMVRVWGSNGEAGMCPVSRAVILPLPDSSHY